MPRTTTANPTPQHNRPNKSTRVCRQVVTGLVLIVLSSCKSFSPNSLAAEPLVIASEPTPITVAQHSTNTATNTATNAATVKARNEWLSKMPPLFNQARSLVEQHTGVDLSDVALNIASDNTITAEVTHETDRLIKNQFDDQVFADRFLNSVMQGQKGTYAALYATRKREVMVSSPLMRGYQASLSGDKDVQEAAILALLIHELVHAADDIKYNIHENRVLNFRASFAQSAAFEGHAQHVTRNICTKANCLSGLEALDQFMFGHRNPPNQLTQSVQAISRNVLEYSYIEGERFIANLASRPNGEQLIGDLLSNPPQDPIQILDPNSYPNTLREQHNQQLIDASTDFSHPWLSGAWTTVQTSPLKGVNLRTDPARRNAAVDGFTRLVTSMVALQLYNQAQPEFAPIELTVMQADTAATAKLFAESLYDNTQGENAYLPRADVFSKVSAASAEEPALMYLAKVPSTNNQTYYTLIGVSGINVVQIAGEGTSESLFVDYVDQLLLKLSTVPGAAIKPVI